MSLPHALLTSLVERPCSGYDLARRFDASIGFFWPASHQQIYRELARMEAAGWISSDQVADHARKRLHRCLPAGEAELRRWVAEGDGIPIIRDPLLVRLRADAALGGLSLAGQLRDRLADHKSRLAAYQGIAERDFGGELDRKARVQQAILDAGIGYERDQIIWCQKVLEVLEADEADRA